MLRVVIALLAISINVNAQYLKNVSLEDLKKDESINQIIASLPEGWAAKVDTTGLYFYRKEKVWIARDNMKSAMACESCVKQMEGPRVINFNMDKRMFYHTEVYVKLAILPLLSKEEISKIKANNPTLNADVQKLKTKHNHGELVAKYNLDESSTLVAAMTKSETKEQTKYLSELNKMGYKALPNYIAEKYCLKLVYIHGDPTNEKSDPSGVDSEFRAIRALLEGYCEEVK